MPDGDIKLTVDLETANAVNSARNLRSVVDNTFAKMSTRKLDDGMKSLVKQIKNASAETQKYEKDIVDLQRLYEQVTAQRRSGTMSTTFGDDLALFKDIRYKMSDEYAKLADIVYRGETRLKLLRSQATREDPHKSAIENAQAQAEAQQKVLSVEEKVAEARRKMFAMEANGTAYPEVTKDIDNMTVALNNTTAGALGLVRKFNELSSTAKQTLDPIQESANRVAQSIGELGKVNVALPVKAQLSEVGQSAQQADQQVAQLRQDITQPMQQAKTTQVIDLSSVNQQLQVIMGQLATLISTTTGKMQGSVQQVATSAKAVGQSIGRETESGFKRGRSSAMSFDQMVRKLEHSIAPIKKQFDKLGNSIRNAGSLIKSKMLGALNKIKSSADNVRKSIGDAFSGKRIKQGLKTLIKYAFGVRSVFFLYRKLRKAVQEGINNLVKFHSQTNATNKQMTEFKTSILYLKNAWASAFAPIINVAMPALTALMDGLAEAGNYIARFIGTLTNQKVVINAVRAGTDDYAKSLDKANKNAKKLNDRLAGFDSLNVLGVDKDTGSGSDDGLPDTNDMFKYVEANDSLADMIRKAWLGDGDFESVGAEIASRFKALLDGVDWDAIQNKAAKFGKVVGTALKGFINDKDMWESLGHTVAQGLNTITIAINEFLQATEDMDWGGGLATAINQFVNETDWTLIGENIENFAWQFKENVINFLKTLNWNGDGGIKDAVNTLATSLGNALVEVIGDPVLLTEVGTFASEFLNTITGAISKVLESTEGTDFGGGLAGMVNTFFAKTDWTAIGENAKKFAKQLRTNITNNLKSLNWNEEGGIKDALKKLGEALGSAIGDTLSDTEFMGSLGTTLGELVNTFFDTIGGILKGTQDKDIGGGFATAVNNGLATIDWKNIGKTLSEGLSQALNNATSFFEQTDWDKIGTAVGDMLKGIDWIKVLTAVVKFVVSSNNALTKIFASVGNAVSDYLMKLKPEDLEKGIKNIIASIDWKGIADATTKMFVAIIKSLFATGNVIMAIFGTIINLLVEAWTNKFNEGVQIGEDIKKSLEEQGKDVTFGNVLEELGKRMMSSIATGLGNVGNWAQTNIIDPIVESISTSGTWVTPDDVANHIGDFKDSLKKKWDEAVANLKNIKNTDWEAVGYNFGTLLSNGVDNAIDGVFGENGIIAKIKGVFSPETFEKIKSTLSTAWGKITGVFTGTWDTIKNTFSVSSKDSIWAKLQEKFSTNYIKTNLAKGLSTSWKAVTGIFTGTWKAIGDHFAVSKTGSLWAKLKEKFSADYIKTNIANGLSKAWKTVTDVFNNTWSNIKNTFTGDNSIGSNITKNLDFSGIKKAFDKIFDIGTYTSKKKDDDLSLFERIFGYKVGSKHINGLLDDLKDKFISTWTGIKTGIKSPIKAIIGMVENVINACIEGINWLLKKAGSITIAGKPILPSNWTNPLPNFTVDYKAIGLAQGAVIPPNKEFLAVLGDQTHGTNIEAPLDTIKQAVAEELAEQIGVLEEGFNAVVNAINRKQLAVGDKEIGKANERYMANQRMIRGTAI